MKSMMQPPKYKKNNKRSIRDRLRVDKEKSQSTEDLGKAEIITQLKDDSEIENLQKGPTLIHLIVLSICFSFVLNFAGVLFENKSLSDPKTVLRKRDRAAQSESRQNVTFQITSDKVLRFSPVNVSSSPDKEQFEALKHEKSVEKDSMDVSFHQYKQGLRVEAPETPLTSVAEVKVPDVKVPILEDTALTVPNLDGLKNYWETTNPSDHAVFLHIPKSAGTTLKNILGVCHHKVLASEVGIRGHAEEKVRIYGYSTI